MSFLDDIVALIAIERVYGQEEAQRAAKAFATTILIFAVLWVFFLIWLVNRPY